MLPLCTANEDRVQSVSQLFEARGEGEETTVLGRLDDVARYLSRHRVQGGSRVMFRQEGSGAAQLIEIAQEERADLYGHSRLGA